MTPVTCRPRSGAYAIVVLAVALLLGPVSARAQVIRSYEGLDQAAGADYYATITFLVDGAVGNSDFIDTNFAGAFGYKGTSHWIRLYPAYQLKRSSGENVVHDRSVHLRHSYIFSDRTRTFAFVQVQFSEALKLERRSLVGGGIRRQLITLGADGGVDLGVGVMLDAERITGEDSRAVGRGANLLTIYGKAGTVTLSSTTYFQPAISDWADHRILVQASAIIPLAGQDVLNLNVSSYWRRDSRPPAGVEKHDAGFTLGFTVNIG